MPFLSRFITNQAVWYNVLMYNVILKTDCPHFQGLICEYLQNKNCHTEWRGLSINLRKKTCQTWRNTLDNTEDNGT